jgi:hypothetical protein
MPARGDRALRTGRLVRVRALARKGLQLSTAATMSVAVGTVCAILASLAVAVERAGDAAPPGVPVDEVAAQVRAGVIALLSAAPALVVLVLLIAGTAVSQLGRLLAAAREQDTANLRARGLSARQATAMDAVEAAAVALVAAVLGLAVGVALSALLSGSDAAAPALRLGWAAPVTALLLAGVLVLAQRRRSDSRGRGTRIATAAVVTVVALTAAFAVWQLPRARPGGFDPIVAIAPSAVLLAGALVALAVFAALAHATARAAAAGTGTALGPRQVSRRLPVYAVAVLLVALTFAQVLFASAYSATWTAASTDSAAVRAGADLRVDLPPQTATPATVADAAAVNGVDAAAGALIAPIEIGSTTGQVVALPAAAIPVVVSPAGGAVDPVALAAALAPTDATVAAAAVGLGDAATGIRVTVEVRSGRANAAADLQLSATFVDGVGTPTSARLTIAPGATTADGGVLVTADAAVPDGTGPWSLLSLSAGIPPTLATSDVAVQITEVRPLIDGVDDTTGDPLEISGEALLGETAEAVLWLAAEPSTDDPAPVRAAIGTDLATRLGLGPGDAVEFRYAGTGRRGEIEVAAVIPAVPGAASGLAVFVPLESLTASALQRGTSFVPPNAVWAAGDPDADAAFSAALGDRPVATAAPGVTASIVGALVPGWWIAAAGSGALALLAAFAIVQTLSLDRRRDLGVLRALGLTPGAQARSRAAELAAVFGTAAVLGAAAGMAVAWLVVPALVAAVTPGILPLGAGVTIAWPPFALAALGLLGGLAVVAALAALDVRRSATGATVGEEAR